MDNNEALENLNKITGILEQHLGPNIFVPDDPKPLPRFTTGISLVDYILGGGIPKGQIIEVFGPEATGKTTFFAQVAAANQTLDPNFRVLYLDYEQKVDQQYFHNLGVDTKRPRFIFSQPKTIEEGALLAGVMLEKKLVSMVVWDSPAAAHPAAELYGNDYDSRSLDAAYRDIAKGKPDTGRIASHAATFSANIGKLVGITAESGAILCFPNQTRTTINTWGAGETTPGGKALKFYASIRIRLSKKQTIKGTVTDDFLGTKRSEAIENLIQFHCVKNGTAPPFKLTDVRLAYGRGFLDKETIFDLARKRKMVKEGGGGNFELPGGVKLRGTEAVVKHWHDNPADFEKMMEALRDVSTSEAVYVEEDEEEIVEELPEGSHKI